jgi:tetratricopeptide (TPR) repeat protein
MFERARDEAKTVTGAGAVELVVIRANTAVATDDPQRRDELLAAAHAELASLLGDNHPDTLLVQWIRATCIASFPRAAELLGAVCRAREAHAWLARTTAACWVELADLRSELGDRPAALAALDRAMELGADTYNETPEAEGYRQLWRGDASAAAAAFEAALAEHAERPNEPWYRAYTRARLALGLGRALATKHPSIAAAVAFERAITILEPIAREERAAAIDRRLGRARAELARVRSVLGMAPHATSVLATAALAWLRPAGAPAAEITALQLLEEVPGTGDSQR